MKKKAKKTDEQKAYIKGSKSAKEILGRFGYDCEKEIPVNPFEKDTRLSGLWKEGFIAKIDNSLKDRPTNCCSDCGSKYLNGVVKIYAQVYGNGFDYDGIMNEDYTIEDAESIWCQNCGKNISVCSLIEYLIKNIIG